MKIEIKLFDRAVDIVSDKKTLIAGGGISDLLSVAKKYGKIIKRVETEGDCQSYTFKRQVFIFANLINYFNGEKVQKFPNYNDQKTSS